MEEKFGSVLNNIRLGLVRIAPDKSIVDKNKTADILLPPSGRGQCISDYLRNAFSLGKERGATKAVLLKGNGGDCIAAAIREGSGSVLLIMHPVLSVHALLYGNKSLSRLLALYSCSILDFLDAIAKAKKRINFIPCTLNTNLTESEASVFDAVNKMVGQLSQTVLGESLTVLIDNRCKTSSGRVAVSSLENAVSELITLRELFGKNEKAELKIIVEQKHIAVTLLDKCCVELHNKSHFIRVFEEMMRLMGLGCHLDISDTEVISARIFVPIYNGVRSGVLVGNLAQKTPDFNRTF